MSSDDEGIEREYSDANRAFVQAFLARGILTFREAQELIAKIFTVQDGNRVTEPDDITSANFDSFISAAASALSPFDYSIRSTFHQTSHARIWALINTTSDPLTQLATVRTADELAFIKRLLDLFFETHNTKRQELMACNKHHALKVAKAPSQSTQARRQSLGGEGEAMKGKENSLTLSNAEKLLDELVVENWFELSDEGFYSLAPRALMELRSWLVATYNDEDAEEGEWQRIKNCVACKEIITVGQRCEERECNIRLHNRCGEGYWKTRRSGGGSSQAARKKCAGCGKEWKGRSFVGERVLTESEKWKEGRRRGRPATEPVEVEEDEDEGENGDDGGEEDADGEVDDE